MVSIDILVGVPGSGKSTWAKQRGKLILNKDSIRSMFYGKYDFINADEKIINSILYHIVKELLRNKRDFIIDECNISKERRVELIRFIKNNAVGECQINAIFFKPNPEVSLVDNRNLIIVEPKNWHLNP